jgi:hypothetical protein
MTRLDTSRNAAQTHNQAGCPYLYQTGHEAVQEWPNVLAAIDLLALPTDLQAELLELRSRCTGTDRPGCT